MAYEESATAEHIPYREDLQGEALFDYIQGHGIAINFGTDNTDRIAAQCSRVVDSIHTRLHGHYEAHVAIGPNPANPAQILGHITLEQGPRI